MFKTRTLFIVGAGASFEAGLPLGRGLADKISGELGFTFDLDRILVHRSRQMIHRALEQPVVLYSESGFHCDGSD